MQRKDLPPHPAGTAATSRDPKAVPTAEALDRLLRQGIIFYKNGKLGPALACLREVAKNVKSIDEGKQGLLAKVLENTAATSLKKAQYKKAIKSAKLAIKVLNQLTREATALRPQLEQSQHYLLLALEGYIQSTMENYKRLSAHELKRGRAAKGSIIQMCRDGINILNKPLGQAEADQNKISKVKNTKSNRIFNDCLKSLLEWLVEQEQLCQSKGNKLDAFTYCKLATGPLKEATALSLDDKESSHEHLVYLQVRQQELEKQLNDEATRALTQGELQTALLHFTYLENSEKIRETEQHLKQVFALEGKNNSSLLPTHFLSLKQQKVTEEPLSSLTVKPKWK